MFLRYDIIMLTSSVDSGMWFVGQFGCHGLLVYFAEFVRVRMCSVWLYFGFPNSFHKHLMYEFIPEPDYIKIMLCFLWFLPFVCCFVPCWLWEWGHRWPSYRNWGSDFMNRSPSMHPSRDARRLLTLPGKRILSLIRDGDNLNGTDSDWPISKTWTWDSLGFQLSDPPEPRHRIIWWCFPYTQDGSQLLNSL